MLDSALHIAGTAFLVVLMLAIAVAAMVAVAVAVQEIHSARRRARARRGRARLDRMKEERSLVLATAGARFQSRLAATVGPEVTYPYSVMDLRDSGRIPVPKVVETGCHQTWNTYVYPLAADNCLVTKVNELENEPDIIAIQAKAAIGNFAFVLFYMKDGSHIWAKVQSGAQMNLREPLEPSGFRNEVHRIRPILPA